MRQPEPVMPQRLPPITPEMLEACRSSVPVELQVPPVIVTVTVREIPSISGGVLTMLWRWLRGEFKSRHLLTFDGPSGLRLEKLVPLLFPGLADPMMGASFKLYINGTGSLYITDTGSRVVVRHKGQTEEIVFAAVHKPAPCWRDAIHTDA